MKKGRSFIRYSQGLKQKVVSEVENGKLTINEAQRLYGIKGVNTIRRWIRSFGKSHLLNQVIHIQMRDEEKKIKELEREKIKELEKQRKALESALAQAHLKIITLESTVRVLEEKTAEKIKKKTDIKSSDTALKTGDSKKEDTQ